MDKRYMEFGRQFEQKFLTKAEQEHAGYPGYYVGAWHCFQDRSLTGSSRNFLTSTMARGSESNGNQLYQNQPHGRTNSLSFQKGL